MTFTPFKALLWVLLALIAIGLLSMFFAGGIWSITGLSITLNLYLSWHHIGHSTMLHYLGLKE